MGGFGSYLVSFACTHNTHKVYDAAVSSKRFFHKDHTVLHRIRRRYRLHNDWTLYCKTYLLYKLYNPVQE